eukprot:NODE_1158_length_1668_cov_26.056208_g1028_i0.p1 GENE.NODE_1158_length_1668_cov_26.056208_g1028_i0~~NODE_1158_length_1668_cov_26.056208_g1028_i0.p1  ORF type:complete len:300 (-),score=2.97 NODE_1158_length_1668_cov_26.056208_g1028_i0:142-1041(-)
MSAPYIFNKGGLFVVTDTVPHVFSSAVEQFFDRHDKSLIITYQGSNATRVQSKNPQINRLFSTHVGTLNMKHSLAKRMHSGITTLPHPQVLVSTGDADPEKLYFIKPSGGTRGKGIECKKGRDLPPNIPEGHIVQEGVVNLDTIAKHKYTIRAYALTFNKSLYLYHDYLLVLHNEPYDPDSTAHSSQVSHTHIKNIDEQFALYPSSQFPYGPTGFPDEVKEELPKVFSIVTDICDESAYRFFGIDFLIDEDGRWHLIEIESTPAVAPGKKWVTEQISIPLFRDMFYLFMGVTQQVWRKL